MLSKCKYCNATIDTHSSPKIYGEKICHTCFSIHTTSTKKKDKMTIKPPTKDPTEYQEQVRYFELVELYKSKYHELDCISSTQNGLHSNPTHVKNMKRAGLIPGYPDIIIDVPSRGYHGARIEMKRRDGGKGLSKTQQDWFNKLTAQGYWCHRANGWEDAWSATCWYLKINNYIRKVIK